MKPTSRRPKAAPLALCVGLLLWACAPAGYLKLSTQVARDFESGVVLPDYQYYTTGSEMAPDAIIGIDRRFTLVTDRWQAVNPTEQQLKDWIDLMTNMRGYGLRTLGSDIIGPQGQHIGIWYSPKADTTVVKMLGDGQVMVYPPGEEQEVVPPVLKVIGVR